MKAERFTISEASKRIGAEVAVRGWLYHRRSSGSVLFLQIRDGSGFIQASLAKQNVPEAAFALADKTPFESAVEVSGVLKEEPRSPYGYEIEAKAFTVLSESEPYPISKKEHGPDFLLSNRHLWLRSRRQWAILRIRDEIITAINTFLHENGFIKVDAPLITPSACEGTTTLFDIDYFGEKAYLSQSGQLYLEAAIFSFGKCYDFGPVLRAEKSKTRRHLIEFWMMDAEMAFADFEEMLRVEEQLVHAIIRRVLKNRAQELAILERNTELLEKIAPPFIRLPYKDAVTKLRELGSDIQYGTDFGNDDESILMNYYEQPVFVTRFPKAFKAFYFKRDASDDALTLSADLLAPEKYGEIAGGGERESDYATLVGRIREQGYTEEDYDWYLDLRKYGSVPHSGFGIGLERLVAWICKLEHVRETIPFPRLLGRFKP